MMQIFETYKNIPDSARGAVLVIGNFDGVHQGHVAVLKRAAKIAQAEGKSLNVLTFEPHPRKLFRPDDPPFRITPLSLKAERLEKAGVSNIFAIPFNWDFASQSAEDFVTHVLKNGIAPAHVVVGHDFRFGQLRKGTPDLIEKAGMKVTIVQEVTDKHAEPYSSSAIRQALQQGRIQKANDMLGWDWEIHGTVIKGDQRGRTLGYPTANFDLGEIVHPAYGVYAGRVQIKGEDQWRMSAINIGIRPMFEVPLAQVEAHIFDFDADIYGQTIKVRPVELLRGEAKFASVDELVEQMAKDCAQAREILEA